MMIMDLIAWAAHWERERRDCDYKRAVDASEPSWKLCFIGNNSKYVLILSTWEHFPMFKNWVWPITFLLKILWQQFTLHCGWNTVKHLFLTNRHACIRRLHRFYLSFDNVHVVIQMNLFHIFMRLRLKVWLDFWSRWHAQLYSVWRQVASDSMLNG